MRVCVLSISFATLAITGSVLSQASNSSFVVQSVEFGDGGVANSATHRLVGSLGAGAGTSSATSATHVLRGGFAPRLRVDTSGAPWLHAVRSRYVSYKGAREVTLHGSELHLGSSAAVTVDGKNAAVLSRSRSAIRVQLAANLTPGYQAVIVQAGGKTTQLARGLGVLPLLETERPRRGLEAFTVRYRGAQGDLVVWLAAVGTGPMIPIAPYAHAFGLDLATLVALPVLAVGDPSGILDLRVPSVPVPRIFFQGLVISTDARIAPGAFTNVIRT